MVQTSGELISDLGGLFSGVPVGPLGHNSYSHGNLANLINSIYKTIIILYC